MNEIYELKDRILQLEKENEELRAEIQKLKVKKAKKAQLPENNLPTKFYIR